MSVALATKTAKFTKTLTPRNKPDQKVLRAEGELLPGKFNEQNQFYGGNYLQQGDVLLYRIDKKFFPTEEERVPVLSPVLQYGTVAAHSHSLEGGTFELFTKKDTPNRLFVLVNEGTLIQHGKGEHTSQYVPPGEYCVGIVQEVDHTTGMVRAIID